MSGTWCARCQKRIEGTYRYIDGKHIHCEECWKAVMEERKAARSISEGKEEISSTRKESGGGVQCTSCSALLTADVNRYRTGKGWYCQKCWDADKDSQPSKRLKPQPPPEKNDLPHVWDLVIKDMHERDQWAAGKYGTHLQPFNGRDALIDAYQEALDLSVYLRQAMYESHEGLKKKLKEHESHPLEVRTYNDGSVSIECVDCCEVLIDLR